MMQLVQLGSLQPLRWMVLRSLCSTVLKTTTQLSEVVSNRQVYQSGGKIQQGQTDGTGARDICFQLCQLSKSADVTDVCGRVA
jgi:hypothetical protein